jgi:hypothetical protein
MNSICILPTSRGHSQEETIVIVVGGEYLSQLSYADHGLPLPEREKEPFLALKVAVDGAFTEAALFDDVVHRCSVESFCCKKLFRGIHNLIMGFLPAFFGGSRCQSFSPFSIIETDWSVL